MAGHMGDERVTVQNLKVVSIDVEKGLIFVKGGVPGAENAWVYVTDAVKKPTKVQLPKPAGLKAKLQAAEAKAEVKVEAEVAVEAVTEVAEKE
jgi:large subunit ribosomal protein L3